MARQKSKNLQSSSYYENYHTLLAGIIRSYNQYISTDDLFSTNAYAVFNTMQVGITKHPLRYYQTEALFLLDHIYLHAQQELYLQQMQPNYKMKDFIRDLLDTIENEKQAPFLAYEMATGSGKTMLMGASIYFLNKRYGVNNFLIITPSSTDIYQKTIRNFQVGNFESVWADDAPFTFNLITGDNYTQNLFFDHSKDANIFIFNISKFGSNAVNTEKTWESAIWQDENNNNISIRQFLKDQKLVIITDEAHHAQTRVANAIIKKFHPLAVLEFTATAIDNDATQAKKIQNIVYKYSIRQFLEDQYGKLVRAVALASIANQKRGSFNDNEKLKLITLLLIHLLKKESLLLDPKCRGLKALSFIKVKEETSYSRMVFDYIRNDLSSDLTNIKIILNKIKNQDLEITGFLLQLFQGKYQNNINLLRQDIQKVANTTIFYHGKSDKETERKFLNIRKNEVELVVYMNRLDEGIDIPNIFSMAVINDSATDFKTSVKQIIGRGVRLNKEKREFDDESDLLKASSEKLHIVCDQGKNFEDVILSIQQEFGLSSKYLSMDRPKSTITNHAKSTLLSGKYIPHIRADFKARDGVSLLDLIRNTDTIVQHFVEDNCFEGEHDETKRFLKYRPDSFFMEVDIFSDKAIYHKQIMQAGGVPTKLSLTEIEQKKIYSIVQKNLHCLPDSETSRTAFRKYIEKFNDFGLKYYRINNADDALAKNLFISAFSFYYRSYIEKNYFKLDFHQLSKEDSWNLKQRFSSYDLKLPIDQIKNEMHKKIKDRNKLLDLINGQYHFYGYESSIYEYVKFDVYPEYQLAEYFEVALRKSTNKQQAFWIRNQRNIWFTYGSRRYFPDYIVFKDDMIYVIETKGEIFSDTKKNALLRRLDEIPGDEQILGYKGVLIFSPQVDKIGLQAPTIEEFVNEADEILLRHQSRADLLIDPPTEEQFITFLPVYSPENAFKKYNKKQKTAKPVGWLKVEARPEAYPKTMFATQVKGNALAPDFAHNSWIYLDTNISATSCDNQICLVYQNQILDSYTPGYTIRKVRITESKTPGYLLPTYKIFLESLNSDSPAICLDVIDLKEIILVAILSKN